MKKLPKARTENIVEQNLEKEVLLYDLITDKAFNLNETSTIVYRACNGQKTFEDLIETHKFTDDFIYLTLDELKRNNLLAENSSYISPFGGMSRREVVKKVGLGTMAAFPVITGLVAPTAANAASGRSLYRTCSIDKNCGADAPNCRNNSDGGRFCCASSTSGALYPRGSTIGSQDYQSCEACYTRMNNLCCSGKSRRTGLCALINGAYDCMVTCS